MKKTIEKIKNHPLSVFGDFRKLFIGRVISAVGDKFFAIAIAWWIVTEVGPNSKMHLGLLMAVNFVPVVLFGPFLGTLVDRSNKKTMMIRADIFRFLLISSLCVLLFLGELTLAPLYVLCFLISFFGPMFESAVSSSLLKLTSKEHLAASASLDSSVMQISNVFGSALGSIMIAAIGVLGAFIFDAFTFLASLAIVLLIKKDLSPGTSGEKYFAQFKEGIAYIWNNRPVFWLIVSFTAFNFFVGPILILIPMIVKFVLKESVTWLAVFETFFALGSTVVAVAVSFKKRFRNVYGLLFCSILLMGLSFLGLYFAGNKYAATLLIFFCGTALGLGNALAISLFQHTVREDMKGRFFSVLTTFAYAVLPLTFMLNGFLAQTISVEFSILFNSIFIILLSGAILLVPRIKEDL